MGDWQIHRSVVVCGAVYAVSCCTSSGGPVLLRCCISLLVVHAGVELTDSGRRIEKHSCPGPMKISILEIPFSPPLDLQCLRLSLMPRCSWRLPMASHSAEHLRESKGPKILGVFWAMTALTLFIVASRLYIRAGVLRNMGTDDWLIAASMVSLAQYVIE